MAALVVGKLIIKEKSKIYWILVPVKETLSYIGTDRKLLITPDFPFKSPDDEILRM